MRCSVLTKLPRIIQERSPDCNNDLEAGVMNSCSKELVVVYGTNRQIVASVIIYSISPRFLPVLPEGRLYESALTMAAKDCKVLQKRLLGGES